MEREQERHKPKSEGDDWLDGVSTGRQVEKRELIGRLHWILDPSTQVDDLKDSGPLVARLNERQDPAGGKGRADYRDGYDDGGSPKRGPEYPGGPTGGPPHPGYGPPRLPPPS